MENKKTLSNRLTTKYLLIVRNEENFAEKTTYSFTYAKIILGLFVVFMTLMLTSFYLATSLLEQWFDPRYAQVKATREVIQLSASLDSLVEEVNRKDAFIQNFKMIMSGEDHVYHQVQDEGSLQSSEVSQIAQSEAMSPIDSQFRAQFEEVGVELSLDATAISDGMEDFYLFKPVEGIVTAEFDPSEDHLAIDIVAKQNEPVKAVADGTVIFASWTQDTGYVMAIQHSGNLISIYKHNSDLLKNVGNFVSAGEVISIIGNTGELTSGPHLHFELWYNGNPINPEEFIRF